MSNICIVETCQEKFIADSYPPLCSVHYHQLLLEPNKLKSHRAISSRKFQGDLSLVFNTPVTKERFNELKDEFIKAWVKPNAEDLQVERIFDIVLPDRIVQDYQIYKATITSSTSANERRLYHGTDSRCNILESSAFCGDDSRCSTCNLIMHSFDNSKIGGNQRGCTFQRLGQGFYFSENTSKSHFYGSASEKSMSGGQRQFRVMFLCKVLLGVEYIPEQMTNDILQPPKGYHSVRGEIGKCGGRGHGNLNYREWAVYDRRACLPINLFVYSYTSTSE